MSKIKPTYNELEKKVLKLEVELKERVKEINCISELSGLVETKDNISDIFSELVYVIKKDWQFPEIAEVRITNKGRIYQTDKFKETSSIMRSDIIVENKSEGEICVVYLESKSKDTKSFLKEEYNLLHILSERLGKIIENSRKSRRYNELFNNLLEGVIKANDEGVIAEINPEAAIICGYESPNELIGKPMTILYPNPERRAELLKKLQDNGGKLHNFEFFFKKKDNTTAHALCNIKMLFNNEGKYIETLVAFTDISEREKAQLKIKQSEKKYRTLFDGANDAIFIAEVDTGIIIDANHKAEVLLGYSKNELIGMHQTELYPENSDKKSTFSIIQDFSLKSKNGKIIPVEISSSVVELDGKKYVYGIYRDISERIEFEQIKESEQRFKNMFERHNAIMLLIDPKTGVVINANDAAVKFYGYSKSILCSMNINDLNTLSKEQTLIEQNKAISEKRHYFVVTHKLASGKIRTVEIHSSPIEFQSKRILFSIIHDITVRKEAELALKESERKLQEAQELSHVGSWQYLVEDDSVTWSKELYNIFEYSLDLPAPAFSEQESLYTKESYEKLKKAVKDCVEKEIPYDMELDIYTLSGTIKHIISKGDIIKDNDKIIGSYGTVQDITKQKKLENAIKESEEKIRLIGDNIPKGQIYQLKINPKGKTQFTYISNKVEELHECTAEQAIEDSSLIFNRILPEDIDDFNVANQKAIREMSEFDCTVRIKRKSGEIHWHRMISRPRKLSNGDILFDGIDIDITFQKEYELLLEKYSKELKSLNDDKDKFISILAHDLKNPFNSLLGFSNLLTEDIHSLDIAKIEKYANIINHAAHKTYKLLDELLLWSRAQSGKIGYKPNLFNLYDAVKSIFDEVNNRALSKEINIKCDVLVDLTVFSDVNLVKTIMRNLISNAIKYTNIGGEITLTAKEEKDEYVISVADTGVGIEKNILSQMFNIAVNNSTKGTNNEEGTGLGLQICKDFVELIGGEIWVDSELGEGSVFYFSIPKQSE